MNYARSNRLPFTAACLALFLIGCAGSPSSRGGAAELILKDTVHSFGNLRAGEVAEWSFCLENGGSGTLECEVLPPDCHCITVRPMKATVEPGKQLRLRVAFNSTGFQGSEAKYVRIRTNTARREVTLLLLSNVE